MGLNSGASFIVIYEDVPARAAYSPLFAWDKIDTERCVKGGRFLQTDAN